jgi:hypothetical protein
VTGAFGGYLAIPQIGNERCAVALGGIAPSPPTGLFVADAGALEDLKGHFGG